MRNVIVISLLFIVSCATVGTRIDNAKILQIKEGKTTKAEVEALLGKPGMINLTSDGKEIMMYHYLAYTPSAQNFIPVVGLISSNTNMDQQITQVLLTKEGIVEKVMSTTSQSNIRSGIIPQ